MSDVDTNPNVSDAHVQSDAPEASAQVDKTAEATAAPGDAPDPNGDRPEGEKPAGHKPIGKRISELTREKHELRGRAEAAESLVERLTKAIAEGRTVQPSGDAAKPASDQDLKPADFASYEDYLDARADRRAERKFAELVEKAGGDAKRRTEEQVQIERWNGFTSALDEQGATIEGFGEAAEVVLADTSFPMSRPMAEYLMDAADHKAGMVKWLAENRNEAHRIYALSPAAAAKELAKVDAQLGQKPPPRATDAPPPAPRVAGRGSAPQSVESMSWEDTLKWARKQSARG